jgi:16S rRNA (uracil1498-N3)-methyltransferase
VNPALRRSAAHVFVESLIDPHLDDRDSHHLLRVLRLRDGQQVSVSDGLGAWRSCVLANGALIADGEVIEEPPPGQPLTVAVAIPKLDRPEWIVQKLTEIGIDQITFLSAERSVIQWNSERAARSVQKLQTVVREAAMQSRRVRLPVVNGQEDLLTFLERSGPASGIAAADPSGVPLDLRANTILIGPEGGWTEREITQIGRTVTLGENILRVETAALVAATQMVALRHGRW